MSLYAYSSDLNPLVSVQAPIPASGSHSPLRYNTPSSGRSAATSPHTLPIVAIHTKTVLSNLSDRANQYLKTCIDWEGDEFDLPPEMAGELPTALDEGKAWYVQLSSQEEREVEMDGIFTRLEEAQEDKGRPSQGQREESEDIEPLLSPRSSLFSVLPTHPSSILTTPDHVFSHLHTDEFVQDDDMPLNADCEVGPKPEYLASEDHTLLCPPELDVIGEEHLTQVKGRVDGPEVTPVSIRPMLEVQDDGNLPLPSSTISLAQCLPYARVRSISEPSPRRHCQSYDYGMHRAFTIPQARRLVCHHDIMISAPRNTDVLPFVQFMEWPMADQGPLDVIVQRGSHADLNMLAEVAEFKVKTLPQILGIGEDSGVFDRPFGAYYPPHFALGHVWSKDEFSSSPTTKDEWDSDDREPYSTPTKVMGRKVQMGRKQIEENESRMSRINDRSVMEAFSLCAAKQEVEEQDKESEEDIPLTVLSEKRKRALQTPSDLKGQWTSASIQAGREARPIKGEDDDGAGINQDAQDTSWNGLGRGKRPYPYSRPTSEDEQPIPTRTRARLNAATPNHSEEGVPLTNNPSMTRNGGNSRGTGFFKARGRGRGRGGIRGGSRGRARTSAPARRTDASHIASSTLCIPDDIAARSRVASADPLNITDEDGDEAFVTRLNKRKIKPARIITYTEEEDSIILGCWDGKGKLPLSVLVKMSESLLRAGYVYRSTSALKWRVKNILFTNKKPNMA